MYTNDTCVRVFVGDIPIICSLEFLCVVLDNAHNLNITGGSHSHVGPIKYCGQCSHQYRILLSLGRLNGNNSYLLINFDQQLRINKLWCALYVMLGALYNNCCQN